MSGALLVLIHLTVLDWYGGLIDSVELTSRVQVQQVCVV